MKSYIHLDNRFDIIDAALNEFYKEMN